MAEPYKHIYKVDLNQQLVRRDVGLLATFDSKANRFGAELYRDGASVSASGYTVNGYFIRPNEETVPIPGTVEGNLVYVDLLPGCYLYDGAFEFALKIKQGDVEQTVLLCYGNVERSRTDATASGGDVLVTVTNAEMLGNKPPSYYLPAENALTLEEIKASTDLSGKIPQAEVAKMLAQSISQGRFARAYDFMQTGVSVPEQWGAVVRLSGENWGTNFISDSYFLFVTSGGDLYTGNQVNGATNITWRRVSVG